MKKLTLLLFASIMFHSLSAQAPKAINYQAVARNAQGMIIPNQTVNVRFSILEGSITGTLVYQETHSATTNNYGLFTLAIGRGTATLSTFAGVNWASGLDKYLKVEIAPQGGTNYEIQGTSQLLSVPYALYSESTRLLAGNAISISNGNQISANYTAGIGINIVGPTISHAMQAGTGINISGATVSHAMQAGTGINISGATVSHALQAGTGINISGATVSHALQAGTGINISGATVSHALQAGTGINISGATVSHALQAGTGINISGATVSHALQAGTGINISGATVSHNLVAGSGINISGNVISAPGASGYWLPHTSGIYYNSNHVGIGTLPQQFVPLTVQAVNTNGSGNAILHLRSTDPWHSAVTMFNGAQGSGSERSYSFVLTGPTNSNGPHGTFGLFNHNISNWAYNVNASNSFVGIGSTSFNVNIPRSRLHVFLGDVNIEQIGSGIIMKSPNGQCWRVTIDNSGNLVRTAISCP